MIAWIEDSVEHNGGVVFSGGRRTVGGGQKGGMAISRERRENKVKACTEE
jgi:hypothetical protein